MKFVSYEEALNFAKSESGKIKVVGFILKDCPTCDDFVKDVFDVEIGNRSEDFEAVYVDLYENFMEFPPVSVPTTYFFIPNTNEEMPLFRVGGTTPNNLKNDLDRMVMIKNEGKTIVEAFYENAPPIELTTWMQRGLRA
jgi:hypothetical protein